MTAYLALSQAGGFSLTRHAQLWYSRALMHNHRQKHRSFSTLSTPRWLGYATAAVATAALSHAQTAEAAVVVVPGGETFAGTTRTFALGSGGANFRLAQQSGSTSYGAKFGIARAGANGGASLRGFQAGNGFGYASKLTLGQAIEPGGFISVGFLASGARPISSQWQTPGTGYLGFQFTDAGGLETGWAELTVSGQPNDTFTLDEYAYGTAGESLTAGQTTVPEPGSLALLAVGGAGLLAWRKRRALSGAKPTLPA